MNGPVDSWTSLTGLRSWKDLLLHNFWQFCTLVCVMPPQPFHYPPIRIYHHLWCSLTDASHSTWPERCLLGLRDAGQITGLLDIFGAVLSYVQSPPQPSPDSTRTQETSWLLVLVRHPEGTAWSEHLLWPQARRRGNWSESFFIFVFTFNKLKVSSILFLFLLTQSKMWSCVLKWE